MKRALAAALVALFAVSVFSGGAEARQRHHKKHRVVAPQECFIFCPDTNPFKVAPFTRKVKRVSYGLVSSVGGYATFVRGRFVCAVNVNRELARRGIRGTGSAMAKSFLRWGSPSSGNTGDIAVFNRKGGGHVAIVAGFDAQGRRLYLNPSSGRQTWQVGTYHKTPIAFRSPS